MNEMQRWAYLITSLLSLPCITSRGHVHASLSKCPAVASLCYAQLGRAKKHLKEHL